MTLARPRVVAIPVRPVARVTGAIGLVYAAQVRAWDYRQGATGIQSEPLELIGVGWWASAFQTLAVAIIAGLLVYAWRGGLWPLLLACTGGMVLYPPFIVVTAQGLGGTWVRAALVVAALSAALVAAGVALWLTRWAEGGRARLLYGAAVAMCGTAGALMLGGAGDGPVRSLGLPTSGLIAYAGLAVDIGLDLKRRALVAAAREAEAREVTP